MALKQWTRYVPQAGIGRLHISSYLTIDMGLSGYELVLRVGEDQTVIARAGSASGHIYSFPAQELKRAIDEGLTKLEEYSK